MYNILLLPCSPVMMSQSISLSVWSSQNSQNSQGEHTVPAPSSSERT